MTLRVKPESVTADVVAEVVVTARDVYTGDAVAAGSVSIAGGKPVPLGKPFSVKGTSKLGPKECPRAECKRVRVGIPIRLQVRANGFYDESYKLTVAPEPLL
jgi:hypothetical protein